MTGNLEEHFDLASLFEELPRNNPKRRPVNPTELRSDCRAVAIGLEVKDLFAEAQRLGYLNAPTSSVVQGEGDLLCHNLPLGAFQLHVHHDRPIERHEFAPVLAFRRPT